jgi:hypothetical protein
MFVLAAIFALFGRGWGLAACGLLVLLGFFTAIN